MLFGFPITVGVLLSVLSAEAAPTVTTPGPVPIVTNAAAIAAGLRTEVNPFVHLVHYPSIISSLLPSPAWSTA